VVRPRDRAPNRLAIGAVVEVEVGGRLQRRPLLSGSSYLSQPPLEAHFGLGQAARADLVRVRWSDGTTSERHDVAADQVLTLDRTRAQR
jgi:hypothetical protein